MGRNDREGVGKARVNVSSVRGPALTDRRSWGKSKKLVSSWRQGGGLREETKNKGSWAECGGPALTRYSDTVLEMNNYMNEQVTFIR